jgi:hypothetical protein
VVAVRAVAEAVASVVCPVTDKVVAVVVARVEVPIATNLPDVVALPLISTTKFKFSVQADPFQ